MKTAIILGGGFNLAADLDRLMLPFDMVVACNDAGATWPGHLDAWVSLHPNNFSSWVPKRRNNGCPPCECIVGHTQGINVPTHKVSPYSFPGQTKVGSSGMFATKYALFDLGADRAVLCGVGLDIAPHFFDEEDWRGAENFRAGAIEIQALYGARIRSMSGWTRVLFGSPADWERQNENDNRADRGAGRGAGKDGGGDGEGGRSGAATGF